MENDSNFFEEEMDKVRYYRYWFVVALIFLCVLPVILEGNKDPQYREVIGPAGNEYIGPIDPAKDDSDSIINDYDQFPDSVKRKIEQVIPGGHVGDIIHWGPFRYIVYKSYNDGHTNKLYIYLNNKVHQVLYIEGKYTERPGVFFETGTEKKIKIDAVPRIVIANTKKISGSEEVVNTWLAESDIGPTYVLEVIGFQGKDTTAFAFRPDGVLKTLSEARRMRCGVLRKWSSLEIENFLGKYRKKFSVDTVLQHIRSVPHNPDQGFRFIVFGDNRFNLPVWKAISKSISNKNALFAIAVGDLVNEGEPEQYDEYLFGVLEQFGHFNFIPVVGNHDIGYDKLALSYLTSFGPNSLNYYFDYGNARFVILDNCSRITNFMEQLEVTEGWLADTPQGYHKFVFLHIPPGDIKKWAYHAMTGAISHRFTEVMAKHNVDHVFAGHIHAYSTATYLDVDYTISGAAGAKLHKQYGPKGSVHSYVIVDVKPEGIQQQLVRIYLEK